MQSEVDATGVHAAGEAQSGVEVQGALQKPPTNPVVSQTRLLPQSPLERHASPTAPGGEPPGSTQLPLRQRCVLGQSRTTVHGVALEQPERTAPAARRSVASPFTSGPPSSTLTSNVRPG